MQSSSYVFEPNQTALLQVPDEHMHVCLLCVHFHVCRRLISAWITSVFWLDALLLTDREHWGSAEEERGMAAEIPGANIAPPPSHDPPQYFSGARSNQGESSELSWVRFWVIISPLLLTLLGCTLALKA